MSEATTKSEHRKESHGPDSSGDGMAELCSAMKKQSEIEQQEQSKEGDAGDACDDDRTENVSTKDVCSNCNKHDEGMKKCSSCKETKYCSKDCQSNHWLAHKTACKERALQLHEEALFRPHPPTEDCAICFLPLPLHVTHKTYMNCCGKEVCLGCMYEADYLDPDGMAPCPFCRTANHTCDEEMLERTLKRMKLNDGIAYNYMGVAILYGNHGCPANPQRAMQLFKRGGELGSAEAYCNLGNLYSGEGGFQPNGKKRKKFYELAAIRGDINARKSLAAIEKHDGAMQRSMKHWLIAAKAGDHGAMILVRKFYSARAVTKAEYEEALRVHSDSLDSMKSEQRDRAVEGTPGAVFDRPI